MATDLSNTEIPVKIRVKKRLRGTYCILLAQLPNNSLRYPRPYKMQISVVGY